jgi:membrane-bound serine protease (ClpP class)
MKRTVFVALLACLLLLLLLPVQAAAVPGQPGFFAPSVAGDIRDFFSDPNVAYLFLALAILGILIEVITPGLYLPGTVGIIAAIVAFYALGLLSVNPLGLILLILALPLFIFGAYLAAAFIPFTIVGIAALVVGSIYLFQAGLRVHPALIAAVVVILSVVSILVSTRVVKAHRLRVVTGRENLLNRTAVVKTPLEPNGTVLVEGELWQAKLDRGKAQPGDEVTITAVEGLKLIVTKNKGGE